MAIHIHPLDIPSQYYTPIGKIIVGWNLSEVLISSIIWKLHKIKDVRRGRALIYGLSEAHGLWGRMPKERLWKVFKMQEMDDELLMIRKEVKATELDPVRIAQEIRTLNSDLKKFMTRNRIPPP